GSYTFLDLQLNHFWNAMVEFLPLWMAPNLVTLTGTIIVILTTVLLLAISPNMEGGAPGWAYVLSGVGLFVYQTLDAIDGKQARRTGSSSPLGQLFDHGCDALSALLNCLTACVAFSAGNSTYTFAGLSSVSVNFFAAQWDEYHTGTMSCGNGYYGVTEGQLTLIVCLLLTAAVALRQLVPVAAVIAGGYLSMIVGPARAVYLSHPLVLVGPFGLNFVLMSSRMIVCHMSKVPFSMQSRILVPLAAYLVVVYVPSAAGISIASPMVASVVYAGVATAVYIHYILSAVFEICAHLKIHLLTLPAKKSE
ncbi:hypothetical protein DYB37_013190, partial [Aphanomyces astaci]